MRTPAQTDVEDRNVRPRGGPLSGLRVADFCWMGVGAMATRVLADLGAQVVKIEDRTRLDLPRRIPIYKGEPARAMGVEDRKPDPNRSGFFNNYNRNKLGVTINMREPRGRELADKLIAASSVVSENFAPGVMERWGLTYDRIRELLF
ncbi:MAG: CoA transferase [Ilumatobacteraceae bacterium]